MFTIQYWNPRDAQWKGCGEPLCFTKEAADEAVLRLKLMTDHSVRFRALQEAAV